MKCPFEFIILFFSTENNSSNSRKSIHLANIVHVRCTCLPLQICARIMARIDVVNDSDEWQKFRIKYIDSLLHFIALVLFLIGSPFFHYYHYCVLRRVCFIYQLTTVNTSCMDSFRMHPVTSSVRRYCGTFHRWVCVALGRCVMESRPTVANLNRTIVVVAVTMMTTTTGHSMDEVEGEAQTTRSQETRLSR